MLHNAVYGHAGDESALERQVNGDKDVVIPVFYMEKQLQVRASELAGRTIYREYEAAKFIIPGDNTFEHREEVTEDHKRRWPQQYAAFKAGLEQTNGMPLDSWYKIANRPGLIEEMRALKIRSVEDLAGLSDDFATRTGWGLEWRKFAKEEISRRASQEQVIEANAGLTAKLAEMEKKMAEMAAALAAAPAEKPKGKGGRPRKTDTVEVAA